MEFLMEALKALPAVASSPYALIGFLVTVVAWTIATHRSVRLKVLMAKLSDIPAKDRAKTVQLEMGEVLPSDISPEQWLRARNQRHFMIAGMALLLTLTLIVAISINAGIERAKLAEEVRGREAEAARHRVEAESRQAVLGKRRQELEDRKSTLDEQIRYQQLEVRRGAAGMQFAPDNQKPLAMQIMSSAANEIESLQKKKAELQSQIDALPLQ